MGSPEFDWEEAAWEHGFKGDVPAMLCSFREEKLTLREIALKLQISTCIVSKQFKKLGIKVIPLPSPGNTGIPKQRVG